jgi:hypothetical protein
LREPPGKVIRISRAVSSFVAGPNDIPFALVSVTQETAIGISKKVQPLNWVQFS